MFTIAVLTIALRSGPSLVYTSRKICITV